MGAILAFNIGTGFATGQEVMQYFSVFGWWSILTGVAFAATMAIGITDQNIAGTVRNNSNPASLLAHV